MLEIKNLGHYNQVVAFAKSIGLFEETAESNHSLCSRLRYLESFGRKTDDQEDRFRVLLEPDFAPNGFSFVIDKKTPDGGWSFFMNGGLLFHGPHDGHGSGAAPVHAVTLSSTYGWAIHT